MKSGTSQVREGALRTGELQGWFWGEAKDMAQPRPSQDAPESVSYSEDWECLFVCLLGLKKLLVCVCGAGVVGACEPPSADAEN